MSEHSPGPWISHPMTGQGNDERIWIEPHSAAGSGPVIATVHVTNRNNQARARADANARLIAAAPEMLKALRDLVRAPRKARNPGLLPEKLFEALEAAQLVIDKAEGK